MGERNRLAFRLLNTLAGDELEAAKIRRDRLIAQARTEYEEVTEELMHRKMQQFEEWSRGHG